MKASGRYALTFLGLFVAVCALLALTGPGRIDIVDGQTRYEVARSLVDHGDHAIRDADIWFGRFPGRHGLDHAKYRFPQTLVGVPAILLSDLSGGRREARRHFFFSVTGALAGGGLAVLFLAWFVGRGLDLSRAVLWAAAGVLATPCWLYATSTFDDILGTCVSVAALVVAATTRIRPLARALLAGLLVGLAFNCKQPLAVVLLPVLALLALASTTRRERLALWFMASTTAAAGLAAYVAYEAYKFPAGLEAAHAVLQLQYMPEWPSKPLANLAALAVSPSAGLLWYCPPVVLGILGLWRTPTPIRRTLLAAIAVFGLFIASMTIFKGDPSWGPRYFTPIYAWLWLFAPYGAGLIRRRVAVVLVVAGVLIQVGALAIDPHRLYVERGLPSMFGAVAPVLYFDPRNAHLLNRPREIVEVWLARHDPREEFSPAPSPTFAFPILDRIERGPAVVERYAVLSSFRPWWASQVYLPPNTRPVSLVWGLVVQTTALMTGVALLWMGLRGLSRFGTRVRASRPLRCQGPYDSGDMSLRR